MESILKKLNIRANEKAIFFNFFLFNLFLYAGIFLGRAIRDALFFSNIGAQYLPGIFILNAVTMTIFGPRFIKWTGEGYSLKKVAMALLAVSTVIIALFSFLFSLNPPGNIPGTSFPLLNGFIILFYWLTEIPIFLMLMLIWIIADNYISESQGQRINPKIIGGGHIGIVIGGIIAVFAPGLFNIKMQTLAYVWAGIAFLEVLMVAIIYKACKPLPREIVEENSEKEGVEVRKKSNLATVKKYKFSFYFLFVTLFNFFLFGINDYMLNTRAGEAGINEGQLILILGYFTIGFGLLSAVVQFSLFTKIIKKFGIAGANLGGASIFVFGAIILLITSTHMFEPFQNWFLNISGIEKAKLFLFGIAIVRFGGYVAEYLFNQSLLPALYGSIPSEDRGVIRSFIEGPFTQMVFGATGIFLILYEAVFKNNDKTNLDLLVLLGAVSASLMLFFSWLMIPEYREILKVSKRSVTEKILAAVIGDIDRPKLLRLFDKNSSFVTTALVDFLSKNKKHEFVGDIFSQFGKNRTVNIAVINGIIELNNLEYFDKLVNKFIEFAPNSRKMERFKRSDAGEIRTFLSAFYRMRHNYDVFSMFEEIEHNKYCSIEQKQEIIYFFSKLDNKNGIIKANKILENLDDKNLAIKLSAEVGFDNFAAEIQAELAGLIASIEEEGNDSQFERLKELLSIVPKINYSTQVMLFDAFKKVLGSFKFLEVRSVGFSVAKKMIDKNVFLPLIAVDLFSKENSGLPIEELPALLADIPAVGEKEISYLQTFQQDFSKECIPIHNNHFSINHLLEDYISQGNPALMLNAYRVLNRRIKSHIEDNYTLEKPGTLFENALKKLYLIWTVVEESKVDNDSEYLLAKKRAEVYFKQSLLYSLSLLPESDPFDVEQFYKNLMSGNRLLKDNSITLLEQALPRSYFKKIDEYFYIDDDANPGKESELAAKARLIYGNEAESSNALKFFNDDILNRLRQ